MRERIIILPSSQPVPKAAQKPVVTANHYITVDENAHAYAGIKYNKDGGKVELKSAENEGTTISCYLA